MTNTAKVIYSEKIGNAIVKLMLSGSTYTVTLENAIGHAERELDTYEEAIYIYDVTCEHAEKVERAARPMPAKPDFVAAINR